MKMACKAVLFAIAASVAGGIHGTGTALAETMMPGHAGHNVHCAAPAPLPPLLAGWANPHRRIKAARAAAGLARATLVIGQPVDAALPHTSQVDYPMQPAKPGGTVSYGGIFAFDVTEAGNYRIALDSHAWTDMIEDGTALDLLAHGHGPACTGVAKMADYTLKPGRHVLQISSQGDPDISIMIVRLP